jgi:hypothetical protein
MNRPLDLHLERLLAASRQAAPEHPALATMPPGFAERVLTLCRVAVPRFNQAALLTLMLRRALVCSAALTLASVIASAFWQVPSDEGLDLARYELQGELLP